MAWILDCDGVVWLADEPIPGAAAAIGRLRAEGIRVVFLTNNSHERRADQAKKLSSFAIPTSPEDVITSPMAVARLVHAGERVLVLGGPGLHEELAATGAALFDPGDADPTSAESVVVGMDLAFSFQRLAATTTALRAGARLIVTSEDPTFPTAHGLLPGTGSLVAAVATAGGVRPIVAGKPHQPVADLLAETVTGITMMVGDQPSSDGEFARLLGVPFGLVLTGVTPPGHGAIDPPAEVEAADLAALVEQVLAR